MFASLLLGMRVDSIQMSSLVMLTKQANIRPTDRAPSRAKFANSSGSERADRASKKKRLSAHTHDIYEGGAQNPHTKEVGVFCMGRAMGQSRYGM